MLKLIKYLKPFIGLIIVIIGLLYVQATFDLSLPQYMSDIVNKGIQQKGITNSVPKIISKTEFERIMIFFDQNLKTEVKSYYHILNKTNMSKITYNNKVKIYPGLNKNVLYELQDVNEKNITKINDAFQEAMIIVGWIEQKGLINIKDVNLPPGVDIFSFLQTLPQEQLAKMQKQIESSLAELPKTIIEQGTILFIEREYNNIGYDIKPSQKSYIINMGSKMVAIALLSMTASVTVGFIAAKISAGLGRNLRKDLFNKVASFSNTEFDKFGAASLITRTTNDIQQVQSLMVMLLRIVFYAPILGVGGVIKVLATDTSMGWIIVVALVAISLIVLAMFIFAVPKFKLVQKLIDKLNLVTRESLTGMMVIRAFNNEDYEEQKFNKANQDLTKVNLFINRIMALMFPLMMLIMNLITILIVWVGSHQIDKGAIQVGDMMAFIQYTMQIIMAFLMITMISIILPRATVSAGRIDEVLTVEPLIKDPQEPKKISKKIAGYINFNNVSFKYNDADESVIKNISFVAKPGQTTAIIGSTGSGKSTIVNLIPRFYDVTAGEILIDGINIRDIKQHDLHDLIGYIPQKAVLFSGTIASNLKYGKSKAEEKELIEAARVAQALDFIKEKDKKFKANIAQGGANVSGGQKQRLAIARALVKKPQIYIFDDTFSALDFKTDAKLRAALKKFTSNSTVLIVAQRISTIINAEQIIVLEAGEIVGIGTHEELLNNCQVYNEIALSQLSKEELAR